MFFVQLLTGLTYGMLYFLIAVGLSIILGVMSVVNLAHGAFFVLGSYMAYSFFSQTENFWVSLVLAMAVSAAIGIIIEKYLLRQVYGKPLEQALLTFGLAFIFADTMKWIWGTEIHMSQTPEILSHTLDFGDVLFPIYRLFVVFIGCAIAFMLWYFESKTRIGAIIRAGVDDRDMVSALGINVGVVFTCVFAFGTALAGLGGALGGPVLGVFPGLDFDILVTSLIVVVIGGLGSWKGSFVAAIMVGLIQTIGQIWFPSLSMVITFLLMILVLMIKPSGLFGRGEVL